MYITLYKIMVIIEVFLALFVTGFLNELNFYEQVFNKSNKYQ